jgi:hypothetical protein
LASHPFFDAFGIRGLYVLPLLCGWLSAVVAGRWMTLAGSRLGPLATLLIGCATPVLFYSLCFSEYTLAVFAGVVATSVLIAAPKVDWRTGLLMAPFLLVAVALRLEMLALAAGLVVAAVAASIGQRVRGPGRQSVETPRRRTWVRYVMAAVVAVGTVAAVIALLGPRQQTDLLRLPDLIEQNLRKAPYLLSGTVRLVIGPLDSLGALGGPTGQLALVLSIAGAGIVPFVRSRRAEAMLITGALVLLLVPSLMIAFGSRPFLGRQGVLSVAPYMILGAYVVPHAWRQRNAALLRLACVAAVYAAVGYFALFSFRISEWGEDLLGLDGSARYMLALYPMGVVLSLVAIETVRASDRSAVTKSAITIVIAAMIMLSLVYEFRGLREMRANKRILLAWEQALSGQERIVSDLWWLPAVLAPLSTTHEMYCVDDARRFPEWAARARAHGATSFAFCTTRSLDADHFRGSSPAVIRDAAREVEGLHIYPSRFRE